MADKLHIYKISGEDLERLRATPDVPVQIPEGSGEWYTWNEIKSGVFVSEDTTFLIKEVGNKVSTIEQTTSEIKTQVKDLQTDGQQIWSAIDQQDNKISLVVDETGNINSANIVASINETTGQSEVKINADKVNLEGQISLSSLNSEAKSSIVKETIIEYGLSNTRVEPPSEWSRVAPEWQIDKFMWMRTQVSYIDDYEIEPGVWYHRDIAMTCIQGAKGNDGEPGTPSYRIDIDNTFDGVPCNSSGDPYYSDQDWKDQTTHTLKVYYGLAQQEFKLATSAPTTGNALTVVFTPKNVYVSTDQNPSTAASTHTLSVTGFSIKDTSNGSIVYELYKGPVKVGATNQFDVCKIVTGAEAVDYCILPNPSDASNFKVNINELDDSGNPNVDPKYISLKAYKIVATNRTEYAGNDVIWKGYWSEEVAAYALPKESDGSVKINFSSRVGNSGAFYALLYIKTTIDDVDREILWDKITINVLMDGINGSSVRMEARPSECTEIGDTFIATLENSSEWEQVSLPSGESVQEGHLYVLQSIDKSTEPATKLFADAGNIKGGDNQSLNIENDFDSVPCNSVGEPKTNYAWDTRTLHVARAYAGDEEQDIEAIGINPPSSSADTAKYYLQYTVSGQGECDVVTSKTGKAYSIYIKPSDSHTKTTAPFAENSDTISIIYKLFKGSHVVAVSKFEASKNVAGETGAPGADSVNYWLDASSYVFVEKAASGELSPEAGAVHPNIIEILPKKQIGDELPIVWTAADGFPGWGYKIDGEAQNFISFSSLKESPKLIIYGLKDDEAAPPVGTVYDLALRNKDISITLFSTDPSDDFVNAPYYDRETLSWVQDGTNGSSAVYLDITNDFDSIPCDTNGKISESYDWINFTSHSVTPKIGTKSLSIDRVINNLATVPTDEQVLVYTLDNISTTQYNFTKNDYELNGYITGIGANDVASILYEYYSNGIKLASAKFEAVKTIGGKKYISFDKSSISVDAENRLKNNFAINFYKTDGGSHSSYSGYCVVYVDNAPYYSSTTAESTWQCNAGTALGENALKVELYSDQAHSTLLDSETFDIVKDGDAGAPAPTNITTFFYKGVENGASVSPPEKPSHPENPTLDGWTEAVPKINIGWYIYKTTQIASTLDGVTTYTCTNPIRDQGNESAQLGVAELKIETGQISSSVSTLASANGIYESENSPVIEGDAERTPWQLFKGDVAYWKCTKTHAEPRRLTVSGELISIQKQYTVDQWYALSWNIASNNPAYPIVWTTISSEQVPKWGTRISAAETSIKQTAEEITTCVKKDGVISSINQTAESITIDASKVNLNGYATFSDLPSKTSELENDSDYQNSNEVESAITSKGYQTASDVSKSKVEASHEVYYLQYSGNAPAGPTKWVESTSHSSGGWTTVLPDPIKGYTYYCCTQTRFGDSSFINSPVIKMSANNTILSWCSSTNTTAIDGANIYTGSIYADSIAANAITAEKLATNAIKSRDFEVEAGEQLYSKKGTYLNLAGTGYLQSKNFAIDGNGNAYFRGNGNFTGTIEADGGSIGGWTIEKNRLYSIYNSAQAFNNIQFELNTDWKNNDYFLKCWKPHAEGSDKNPVLFQLNKDGSAKFGVAEIGKITEADPTTGETDTYAAIVARSKDNTNTYASISEYGLTSQLWTSQFHQKSAVSTGALALQRDELNTQQGTWDNKRIEIRPGAKTSANKIKIMEVAVGASKYHIYIDTSTATPTLKVSTNNPGWQ